MKQIIIVTFLSLLITACSKNYDESDVTILSVDERSVLYKIVMDTNNYSPGINFIEGEISFPKCRMNSECNDITYKAQSLKFNKYVVDISDQDVLKKLKKRVKN